MNAERAALVTAINEAADIRLPDGRLAIARDHAVAVIEHAEVGEMTEVSLRTALELLLLDVRPLVPDEPPERMITTHHRVQDIRQARLAVARAQDEGL